MKQTKKNPNTSKCFYFQPAFSVHYITYLQHIAVLSIYTVSWRQGGNSLPKLCSALLLLTTVMFFLSNSHPHPSCAMLVSWSILWPMFMVLAEGCPMHLLVFVDYMTVKLVCLFFSLCILWIETEGVTSFLQWAAQNWAWYSRCGLISAIYKAMITSLVLLAALLVFFGWRCMGGGVWGVCGNHLFLYLRFLSENFLFCYAKGAEL